MSESVYYVRLNALVCYIGTAISKVINWRIVLSDVR